MPQSKNHKSLFSFFKSTALLFFGNLAIGALVYILQVIMGRLMGVIDYGLFSASMGIFNIAALPVSSLVMVVTKKVAIENARGNKEVVAAFWNLAIKRTQIGFLSVIIIGLVFSSFISKTLETDSYFSIIFLIVAIGFNIFLLVLTATLQGLQSFNLLVIGNTGVQLFRIALCFLLVRYGYGVLGAMGGICLSVMLGCLFFWVTLNYLSPRTRHSISQEKIFSSKEAIILTISNLAFVCMTQSDYIIMRIHCLPETAGLYSAGAMLAKSILWLPVGIVIALYPIVAGRQANQMQSKHLLSFSLGMAFVFSALLTILLAGWSSELITWLYGAKFSASAKYLRYLSISYLPLSLVLVMDNYQLALGKARFIPFYVLGASSQWLIFGFFDANSDSMLIIHATQSVVCFTYAIFLLFRESSTVPAMKA